MVFLLAEVWDLLDGIPIFTYFALLIKTKKVHGNILIVARPGLE
jgi:hypothetical protein